MKQGTTYTIKVKRIPQEFLLGSKFSRGEHFEEKELIPDFEEAAKLYDELPNEKAKKCLERYARKFDIEIKRSKSFQNMLKDFKEAYNGKE